LAHNLLMIKNPVGYFEIYVQDMNRAKAFYETVLDTTLTRLGADGLEMMAFPADMSAPGTGGALVHAPGVMSGGNSVLVYFNCEDCGLEGSRVAAAGGTLQREKMSIGEYGFIVLAYDTEGNMFGLHSMI
jgi:predicted enzyme related to lactoylglutathione lyase